MHGMVSDFWNSITEWFKEKTTSPLYGVYVATFVAYNWEKFYVLFWGYGAPAAGTRLEFLYANLLPFHGTNFLYYPAVLGNWLSELLPPAIVTYFIILYVPKAQNWAHNLHLKYYFERKKNSKIKEQEYEEFVSTHLENIVIQKQKQVGSAKTVEELTAQINALLSQVASLQGKQEDKKILNEQDGWEKQYEEFENGPHLNKFRKILETVYKHEGMPSDYLGTHADAGTLAFADTQGLIVFSGQKEIKLTEKGRFFAKKYLSKYPI